MLRIDVQKFSNKFLEIFKTELYNCLENWKQDVLKNMSNSGNPSFLVSGAKVDYEIRKEAQAVIAYLKANNHVLASSYGTGSLMLEDNPGLAAYRWNTSLWNQDRQGNAIYGRRKGESYKDFFSGKAKVSKGKFEGQNIENRIKLISPTYALQDAKKYLYTIYIPRAYKNAMKKINFSSFLIEEDR